MFTAARTATAAAGLTLICVVMLPGGAAAQTGSATSALSVPQQMPSDPSTDVGAPALSNTGRYIAHIAIRRDVTNPRQHVRRTDMTTGGFELLNVALNGGVAAGNYSRPPVISGDGSRVAFTTNGGQLVAGDTNGRSDAFVRDASTNSTLLTSRAYGGGVSNGDSGMTSLSKSGRYAVFTSSGTDVVPGSTTTNFDVYRRDLNSNTTVQVTVRPNGAPSIGPGSSTVDVSADGHLVAFNSYNTDLAPADGADQESDLFIRNMTTNQTVWLSPGLPVGADPAGVVISPNGRWVSSRWNDGSLHLTRVDTRVTSTVAADAYALTGAFSADLGRFVFVTDGRPYVRNLSTGVNTAIAVPSGGFVTDATISGNGQFAAYSWTPSDGSASRIFRVQL
jgi:hypothetical protein